MKSSENLFYVFFLSIVGALGGFLFGYDTAVISGTIESIVQQYQLDSLQEGWYVGCALIGSIGGVAIAGVLSDYAGRRPALWLAATLFTLSSIGCMFASSFSLLVVSRILGGIGIGIASIISPLYISEVATPKYRGTLVSLYQLAITVGILASYFANAELLKWSNQLVSDSSFLSWVFKDEFWRGMLGLETIPAALFFAILFFIPESPRWQIANNKLPQALTCLSKIYGPDEAQRQIQLTLDAIKNASSSDWSILFSKVYKIPLLIGISLAILGQFMGPNAIFYYGPKIFAASGMEAQGSLDFQIIVGVVNVLSTMLGMYLVDKIGRKMLVYIGVSGMLITLIAIGCYFFLNISSPLVLLGFIMTYIFFCAISICVVIWVLMSEMYPVKMRGIAMSCAGFSLWVGTYLIGQLTPMLISAIGPAFTFWIFALMCLPYLAITYFLVPETTGKSLEEIDAIWQNKQ